MTREDIVAVLGPVDDLVIAAMGATAEELAEAGCWVANDEPLIGSGRPLASGRVGRLVELLAAAEEDDELDPAPGAH